MSRVFYRYVRPFKFNTKRLDFDTLPNGGVCLRFEQNEDGTTLFTYSRCHPEDHFDKRVAKAIADARVDVAKTDERLVAIMSPDMRDIGQSTEELADFIIAYCRSFDCNDFPFLVGHYLSIEWEGFSDALERIQKHNARELEIGRIWCTAVQAMDVAKLYIETP